MTVKSKMPKILILNNDLPVFPGWGGIEFLHTTFMAQMAQKVGLVSLVHTPEQNQKKSRLADSGVTLYLWKNPNMEKRAAPGPTKPSPARQMGKVLYDFCRSLSLRPHDTLFQDFQFSTLSGSILQALNEETWDILVVVQSSCARWVDYLPAFPMKVLMMHDTRALVYERRARVAKNIWERAFFRLQALLYRHFEKTYARKFDLIVTVSSADEAWVRRHCRPRRVITIPIPIDGTYFAPLPDEPLSPSRILFTGMMNHPPNVDAVCFFARKVFPKIKNAIPKAQFWIVGRDPADAVKQLEALPGVVVTGFVPDIRKHKASCAVEVVPLRFGAGMRQKILEAWAMKKCVVSTRIGAEGIDYQDGKNILIADDADTMVRQVVKVLHSIELSKKIGDAGYDVVSRCHHPQVLSKKYFEAMVSVLKGKGRPGGPMRTIIDLRWMLPGIAGGIEDLARSFLGELKDLDCFNRYTLLLPSKIKYDFDLRKNPNFKTVAADGPSYYGKKMGQDARRLFHRAFHLNNWRSPEVEILKQAKTLKPDLVLSFSGYIYPDMRPLKNVVVVPDLQHEYCPHFFTPDVLAERKRIYGESIASADGLIAISEYTRQTIIEKFKMDPSRIQTIHLAADPMFHPENISSGNRKRVLDKYGLPEKGYLFLPANTWVHKNHKNAVKALQLLRRDHGHDLLLVCTGSPKDAQEDLNRLIQHDGLEGAVRFLGYCPKMDLVGLYEGAAALIYPSFFEGFGMPLIEAMWTDCPVVCSNVTSMPEIAGDAALLVDPQSPEALAEAANRVLTDEGLRLNLIDRGRERARTFSWSKFTREVIKLLHQVKIKGH
jgi:glycosyltransferase involved in cell wall biosynthesis